MASLPTLHRASTASEAAPHLDATQQQPSTAGGGNASAKDGINRNRLRQEAGWRVHRITCGVAERETYQEVVQHMREQFVCTSRAPLRPLVLPPHAPSNARPREPQLAKFSREVAASPKAEAVAITPPAAAPLYPSSHVKQRLITSSFSNPAAASIVVPGEDLPTQASFSLSQDQVGNAHRWDSASTTDRAFFRRRIYDAVVDAETVEASMLSDLDAQRGLVLNMASALDTAPLLHLDSAEAQHTYLEELETASRQHMMAYEKWEQQVVIEMMAVRYVTLVLKPGMDELRFEEAEAREAIYQEEDQQSYAMWHESALAMDIEAGLEAMTVRREQLRRIQDASQPKPRRASSSSTPPLMTDVLVPAEGGHRREMGSLSNTSSLSSTPGRKTPQAITAPEARNILEQYTRLRGAEAMSASSTAASLGEINATWMPTLAATNSMISGLEMPGRRTSALVVPSAPSVQAPRRNAVGIAHYVDLLDTCTRMRDHQVEMEAQARQDLLRACYEEQQVVLEWQRRRMHLERLIYWRHQREAAVLREVALLTLTAADIPLPDPVHVRVQEELADAEMAARSAMLSVEQQVCDLTILPAAELLNKDSRRWLQRSAFYASFQASLVVVEQQERQQHLMNAETDLRRIRESHALAFLNKTLQKGHDQLTLLGMVVSSPAHYSAMLVLQRAFRQSLKGHLGWRVSHVRVGRAIADVRNRRKTAEGRQKMRDVRKGVEAGFASVEQERAAQLQRALADVAIKEMKQRCMLSTEEVLSCTAIRRAWAHNVETIYRPLRWTISEAENAGRLVIQAAELSEPVSVLSLCGALMSVLKQKKLLCAAEGLVRAEVAQFEHFTRQQLEFLAPAEAVRIAMVTEAIHDRHALERQYFIEQSFIELRAVQTADLRAFAGAARPAQLKLLSATVTCNAPLRAIVEEERVCRLTQYSDMATHLGAAYAAELLEKWRVYLQSLPRRALFCDEVATRAALVHAEVSERRRLLSCSPSGHAREGKATVRTNLPAMNTDTHAGAVINPSIYPPLSERALADLMGLVQEAQRAEAAEVQQKLEGLVTRGEPQSRAQVEALEEVVRGVLLRGAAMHARE